MSANTTAILSKAIDRLVEVGMSPGVAGALTAEIYAAGKLHGLSTVGDLAISHDGNGSVILQQADAAVTIRDRDAVRIARSFLAAAGYADVQFYRTSGIACYDLEDDDPPDAQDHDLRCVGPEQPSLFAEVSHELR